MKRNKEGDEEEAKNKKKKIVPVNRLCINIEIAIKFNNRLSVSIGLT